MKQMSVSTQMDTYKFEIDDGYGFQYIEEDIHMHGNKKLQYTISLDYHRKLHMTPVS